MRAEVESPAEMAGERVLRPSGGEAEGLHHPASVFSTYELVEVYARALGAKYRAAAIPVRGSGPPRTLYALEVAEPLGLRSFSLGPCGLYANPAWDGRLERSTLKEIVARLKGVRVRKFGWKVLFAEEELASGLCSLDLVSRRESTHVLSLAGGYEHVFAGYSATIRNEVRKARARGVRVRDAVTDQEVDAYYAVHTRLAQEKGYGPVYPRELFRELRKLPQVRLLVAECEGRVAAGGLFFQDGRSILYWHGAADRNFYTHFPSRLVLDEAIRWGCETGTAFVNFGGSAGIVSLERFKSLWGAKLESNWTFEWENPLWRGLARLKSWIARPNA
jgi:hypothetical protein